MISPSNKFVLIIPSENLYDDFAKKSLSPVIDGDQGQWDSINPMWRLCGGPKFPIGEKIKVLLTNRYKVLPPIVFGSRPPVHYLRSDIEEIFFKIFGQGISLAPLESMSPSGRAFEKEYKACFFKGWVDPYHFYSPLEAPVGEYGKKVFVTEVFSWEKIKEYLAFRSSLCGGLFMQKKIWDTISKTCPELKKCCDEIKILVYGENSCDS